MEIIEEPDSKHHLRFRFSPQNSPLLPLSTAPAGELDPIEEVDDQKSQHSEKSNHSLVYHSQHREDLHHLLESKEVSENHLNAIL